MAFTAQGLDGGSTTAFGDALAPAAFALARRFAAGATMWCVAPTWRQHARHVAVEFVHPVIVGKPALPSVSVEASDPVGALRTLIAAGDVVVTIGRGDDVLINDIVRRAPAWGAMSIWIGAGPKPSTGAADHVLWTGDDAGSAVHDGRLVLQYHVLWELTHVCLEHPGLLGAIDPCDATEPERCVTCSDEGRVGEVMTSEGFIATVRTASGVESVDTTLVGDIVPGDLLVIHAGTAITVLDEERSRD